MVSSILEAEGKNNKCIQSQYLSKKIIYIDIEKCIGCGLCSEICPFGLPKKALNGKFEIEQVELCVECSACQRNCPKDAIIMEEQKGCGCLWNVRNRKKANCC